jgi:hypothetical protein
MSIIFSLFLPSTKIHHTFLPNQVCGNKYFSKFEIKNHVCKKEPQMIQTHLFQEKEMEGGEGRSQLSCQWKVSLLGGP